MTEILFATLIFVLFILALSALVLATRRVLRPGGSVDITLNGTKILSGSPGSTLLEALLTGNVAVPAACGGKGSCGLCRVKVPQGGGPLLQTETDRLSRTEQQDHLRLACQVRLRGDVSVLVDPALLDVTTYSCRVQSSINLTPTIKEIVIDLPTGWDFEFRPGDFVLITAPPFRMNFDGIEIAPEHQADWIKTGLSNRTVETTQPVTRAYSIANRPEDRGRIVLNIRLALPPPAKPHLPPGLMSSWLFGLKQGDEVKVSGPFGEFHVQPGDAEIVCVAGGVGMAPIRAIIHDEVTRNPDRKISFFYGARSTRDLFYASEFEALEQLMPNFGWIPALSEPNEATHWPGAVGFIHDALIRDHLDIHSEPEACEYYLCGPPLMIRAVIAALNEAGVDRDQIFFDDFGG